MRYELTGFPSRSVTLNADRTPPCAARSFLYFATSLSNSVRAAFSLFAVSLFASRISGESSGLPELPGSGTIGLGSSGLSGPGSVGPTEGVGDGVGAALAVTVASTSDVRHDSASRARPTAMDRPGRSHRLIPCSTRMPRARVRVIGVPAGAAARLVMLLRSAWAGSGCERRPVRRRAA